MSSGAVLSVFIIAVIAVFVASYLPRLAARVRTERATDHRQTVKALIAEAEVYGHGPTGDHRKQPWSCEVCNLLEGLRAALGEPPE